MPMRGTAYRSDALMSVAPSRHDLCGIPVELIFDEEQTVNISDRRFIYNKRTDVATRFRQLGWEPPEKHAEELENIRVWTARYAR